MDLSICILTHCQPELLSKCLAACVSEVERAGIQAEIIIVDNASADAYPQALAQASPQVRIIRSEENLGFSAGNNLAIRQSQGKHILVLNDDAVLQKGSLECLLRELESHPDVGAVGPRLLNPDGSPQVGFTNKRFPHIRGILSGLLPFYLRLYRRPWARRLLTEWNDSERTGDTDYVAGACLLSPRAALTAIGGFDEHFFFWLDDTDLCYRLKKAGYRVVYIAEAHVIHYGSASLRTLPRSERHVILLQSLSYYFRKHHGSLRCLAVRLSLVMAYIIRIPMAFLVRLIRGGSHFKESGDSMRASFAALRVLLK